MPIDYEERGKDSLALSQASVFADFDQLEPWAMPCAPAPVYKSLPFDLGGYEPPQSPLNPGMLAVLTVAIVLMDVLLLLPCLSLLIKSSMPAFLVDAKLVNQGS